MQPLLSVIIPVYNVEKYIDECMESIVKQLPGADMEIICVDDGSTDASGAICDRYAGGNSKIKVVHHQKNQNLASARNTGLAHACGRYIAWIDSDDYVAGDWYEKISAALKADETIDILLFDYVILKDNRKIIEKYGNQSGMITQKELIYQSSLDMYTANSTWQMVFRRSIFDDMRFPVSVVYGEDLAALHKFFMKAGKIYYLSQVLYFYRVRDDSLTGKVTLDQRYGCYLMAREKYEYLKERGFAPSATGYLHRAWSFCLLYHRSDASARASYKEKYDLCRGAIRQNIAVLLKDRDSSFKIKIKFLLVYLGLLSPAVRLYVLMKSLNK